VQNYLQELEKPSTAIYKLNNLTSTFTKTYNHTRCPFRLLSRPCATEAPHDGPRWAFITFHDQPSQFAGLKISIHSTTFVCEAAY
jgi:hypothetical protein